jgi:uncharacterized protein YkwD
MKLRPNTPATLFVALASLSLFGASLSACMDPSGASIPINATGTGSDNPTGTSTGPGDGTGSGDSTSNPTGVALDAEEQAFVETINAYRAQNGLAALQVSATLTESSKWMSADMAAKDYFSHTDSQGRDPFTRMADFGYPQNGYSGENIAAGNASAAGTFTQWKNSPGHNANMLGASYRVIGVGRAHDANSSYGWYWTTDFGSTVDKTL